MKEKLTKNIGLKVLSIILAAILWLVITNVDDPVVTKPFRNVPVKILHEEAIASLGQVYEITEGSTIDFTFAARRSIADNLTVSDFQVTADFSKLSDVNAVTIDIKCPRYPEDVTIIDGIYQVMKVNLEELVEKNFKVNVVQKGQPADGYYVAEKTANTIIKVSGPKSKIESIAQIVCEVDVSDVAGSFKTSEEPKALDEDGNEIDSSNLDFSARSVSINIGMYKTKTIDLLVTTTGEPSGGYIMTTVDYEPKTIEVAGEDLRDVQSLTVTEDLNGAYQNIQKEVNIQEQLPDGLILVGDNQTVTINIGITRAQTKEFMINPDDLEVRNKPANMDIMFMTVGPISVKVKGPMDDIAKLDIKDLNLYIDLINYTGGSQDIPIGMEANGYFILENQPTVRAYLQQ
jgi:YbbR domain-containing protein